MITDWDQYFITFAYYVSMKSKDQRTFVGSVIVGPDNEIRTTGYNSFPRNLNDDVPERQIAPVKYDYFEHAERNAIYNAARYGASLKGCRMYVPWHPCAHCARGIIQAGITEVIIHTKFPGNIKSDWDESKKRGQEMFDECGVKVREWDGELLDLRVMFAGQEYGISDLK